MEKNLNQWKDSLGIFASATCAVHCAATPIFLAFLPALKLTEWMASPRFHQIAAVVCVGMVSLAIWPAFRRFRDYRVLSLSTAGLGLLIAAAFILPDECCSHTIASASSMNPHVGHSHSRDDAPSHASHDHASHDPDNALTTSAASTASGDLFAVLQPWMTPLGGLLLVFAHSLNLRRRVCSKSRCECRASTAATHRREEANSLLATANTKAA